MELKLKYNYEDGRYDGLRKYWFENGQLYFSENYKDGQQDGLHQDWYENGQLKKQESYLNGKLNWAQFWDKNGQPLDRDPLLTRRLENLLHYPH